jgi:hypothetical protein
MGVDTGFLGPFGLGEWLTIVSGPTTLGRKRFPLRGEWDFHLRGSLDHGVSVDWGAAWVETSPGLIDEDGSLWLFTQFSI